MLRLFFERITEPFSERVCSLLIDFTRYTNRLGNLGSEFQAIATRIKYKMAQLCELIVAHKDRIPLINNPVVKNQMIDYFLAWATNVNMVLSAFYDGLKLQA
ncbi:Ras GTPase activating protein ira2 [Puccinia graminis f. sp. tritici]|uniref:Ras GTPase activating protein ira2 n=1 Tax=Puccinia graminis f. sp. tritici TaxID=56615 RepID=A0A5B0PI70_PUCGR|nr:Ras GTPase activating protein ira2 [Puccinia graminis f. sp. tritici]